MRPSNIYKHGSGEKWALFKKMIFMSILVLIIDVIVRAFVCFFFKPETDGCRGIQMCYIHLYKNI